MDGLPKPPEDEETKNVIDRLANFVARNGPEFEAMTKQKQKDNPRFSFLFGGENFSYYQYKVTSEQNAVRQQQEKLSQQQAAVQQVITAQSIQSAPWVQQQQQMQQLQEQLDQQRHSAAEQIKQSEINLAAQYDSILQQQQVGIDDAIYTAKWEELERLSRECEISLDEMHGIVQPIIDSCTKEAIANGKNWIFSHNHSQNHANLIANYLLERVSDKDASFECRLHIIYLINDVIHNCVRKNAEYLRDSLSAVVVPIVCISQLGADESRSSKITKLLTLWGTNEYFDATLLQQMNDPMTGMSTYQTMLLSKYSDLVQRISDEMNSKYTSLQQQHQEFVNHLQSQISQLEQQLQQQQRASSSASNSSVGLVSSGIDSISNQMRDSPASMMNQQQQHSDSSMSHGHGQNVHSSDSDLNMGGMGGGIQGGMAPHDRGGYQPFSGPGGPPMGGPPMSGPPQFGFGQGPPGSFGGNMNSGDMPPRGPQFNLPDFSKPPPGFPGGPGFPGFGPGPGPMPPMSGPGPMHPFAPMSGPPGGHMGGMMPIMMPPPPMEADLMPSMPYFDLPAGLMAPLVKLEDTEYRPLDPKDIRLPPPLPPTERLLAAVEAFYSAPSHERPRDSDGWEKLGLFEFFKAKKKAKQLKAENGKRRGRSRSESPRKRSDRHDRSRGGSRSKSRSRSDSRSRSRSSSRSSSRSGDRRSSRKTSPDRGRSSSGRRSRSPKRSPRRSPRRSSPRRSPRRSPPARRSSPRRSPASRNRSPNRAGSPLMYAEPYYQVQTEHNKLGEDNKGHMLLTKMGWGGGGLGTSQQGIVDPIASGDVRDRNDKFKGIGISLNDPFEQFRKNRSQGYSKLMKEKSEIKASGSSQ